MERSRNYATLSLRFFSISGNLFPDIESLRRDVHCDTGKMLRVMITGAFLYQNDVGVKRYFDPFDHVFGGSRGQKSSCKQVCIGFLTF